MAVAHARDPDLSASGPFFRLLFSTLTRATGPSATTMSTLAKKLNAGLNLSSKLAVVAGGSQGIGAGIAVRLAEVSRSSLSIVDVTSRSWILKDYVCVLLAFVMTAYSCPARRAQASSWSAGASPA